MYCEKTEIKNKTGLHARPASVFVLKAKTYTSRVFIRNLDVKDSERINAKSIVLLLAEGIGQGTRIEISASGPDEKEAVDELCRLIETGFGE